MPPTLYDVANLQQIQNGLSPLLDAQALEYQQRLRQQALAEQYGRLFQTQQFQRDLQSQQEKSAMERTKYTQGEYLNRLEAMDKNKTEALTKDMDRRNEAAKRNLQEMDKLQANLDVLINSDQKRRVTSAEKYAAAKILPMFAKELAPIMETGVTFEEAVKRMKDPVKRQEILSEYGNEVATLMSNPAFAADPAIQARKVATVNRLQQLNEALGTHMAKGGDLPSGGVDLLMPIVPEAAASDLPFPPPASATGAARLQAQTPQARMQSEMEKALMILGNTQQPAPVAPPPVLTSPQMYGFPDQANQPFMPQIMTPIGPALTNPASVNRFNSGFMPIPRGLTY